MNLGRTGMELDLGKAIVFIDLEFGMSNAKSTSVDMTDRLKEHRVDHRSTKTLPFILILTHQTGLPIRPAQPVLRASSGHSSQFDSRFRLQVFT